MEVDANSNNNFDDSLYNELLLKENIEVPPHKFNSKINIFLEDSLKNVSLARNSLNEKHTRICEKGNVKRIMKYLKHQKYLMRYQIGRQLWLQQLLLMKLH